MLENIWVILHLFGVAIGAGSITTAYARELYFKWHPEHESERGLLPIISPLLNIAFALVLVSGFGLYLGHSAELNQSPLFWTKIALFGLLFANHILINAFLRARRESLPLISAASEYFSLLGWYLIIALSVFL